MNCLCRLCCVVSLYEGYNGELLHPKQGNVLPDCVFAGVCFCALNVCENAAFYYCLDRPKSWSWKQLWVKLKVTCFLLWFQHECRFIALIKWKRYQNLPIKAQLKSSKTFHRGLKTIQIRSKRDEIVCSCDLLEMTIRAWSSGSVSVLR